MSGPEEPGVRAYPDSEARRTDWAAVVIGVPLWSYDETADEYVCPEPGCGHRIGWAATRDPAAIARSDDPSDATKTMLVCQGDHTEAAHPETLRRI